jgi:hypothetical protein
MKGRWVVAAGWVVAAFWVGGGLAAFLAPKAFYDSAATFPPYNVHFVHDIGAFQIGLGAVIVLALLRWSSLAAALVGVGIGSAVHAVSHVIDYDLKPDPLDLVVFVGLTIVTLAAGLAARSS